MRGRSGPPELRNASAPAQGPRRDRSDRPLRALQWFRSAATRLSVKLGLASALVVVAITGTLSTVAYRRERATLLQSMQRAAATQGELVVAGLRFAMLDNSRELLTETLERYGRRGEVRRLFLANARGEVAIATEAGLAGRTIGLPQGVCPSCDPPLEHLTTTQVVQDGADLALRSLTVIPNEARCHRCHPSGQKMLGALGVDFSLAPLDEARSAIVRRTLLWGAALPLLLLVGVGAVVQLGALVPLRRLRDTAHALASAEAPELSPSARGGDEIRDLAHHLGAVSSALRQTRVQFDVHRQFLVDLIDQIDDGLAVFDRSGRVFAANRSYLAWVGRSREELARGEVRCDEAPLCRSACDWSGCAARQAFRTGRPQKRIHRMSMGDREAAFEVVASPILGADGAVEQVVEVWRDVTERVAVQANLARSEQLAQLGVLASGLSHEISTPLGTISTSIQGLVRMLGEREQLEASELRGVRERLDLALSQVFRCREITRSFLEMGRERRTALDRMDVEGVAARMLELIRPAAERRGVLLSHRSAAARPSVMGHRDQLEQVLLNLYVNALEAMPQGGELRVEVADADGGVEIAVGDTGAGVAPEDAARVFEPFFTRKPGGTGLGLYVSRQIVEAHGGRLSLSGRDGRGAWFRVFLPADGAGGAA